MIFTELSLPGCFLVTPELFTDERGFFARFFCEQEFAAKAGIFFSIKQINNSASTAAGTWRGLHYQVAPHGEAKYLRCIAGSVLDFAVDLRESSPTFLKSVSVELTAENRQAIFIPEGFAHGFLTLAPNSEVIYGVSALYSKDHERAIRWDDPNINLALPFKPEIISAKDLAAPFFAVETHASGYTFQEAGHQ
ncbi:MAG TPA: dTDP-4-dehydrorhamnose 3,5-epimerase [Fimbriimonadaceae bacterium]|jgi:dTDP-4-dehydrorhamnose 3,5-epimerase